MNATRLLTKRELEAFRHAYGDEIGRHQRVVKGMKAAGVNMLWTEGAVDARRRFGRDEERDSTLSDNPHGHDLSSREIRLLHAFCKAVEVDQDEADKWIEANSDRRGAYGRDYEPAPEQPTVDEAPMRDYLKRAGLSEDDVEHAAELMREAREAGDRRRPRSGKDQPPPFRGRPTPGHIAGDRAPGASYRDFAARYPMVGRIRHV
jgi:hypothetical protein